jgi:hypothetical protein
VMAYKNNRNVDPLDTRRNAVDDENAMMIPLFLSHSQERAAREEDN